MIETNNRSNRRRARPTNRYCWTHGTYGHNGQECKHSANSHKPDATFQNRMGGFQSRRGCWNRRVRLSITKALFTICRSV